MLAKPGSSKQSAPSRKNSYCKPSRHRSAGDRVSTRNPGRTSCPCASVLRKHLSAATTAHVEQEHDDCENPDPGLNVVAIHPLFLLALLSVRRRRNFRLPA